MKKSRIGQTFAFYTKKTVYPKCRLHRLHSELRGKILLSCNGKSNPKIKVPKTTLANSEKLVTSRKQLPGEMRAARGQ